MRLLILTLWRLVATMIAIAVMAVVLAVVSLEHLLMVNEPLHPARHAVVLDGDNMRLFRAREIFEQGLVDDIFVSDGEPAHPTELDKIVEELGYKAPDRTRIKREILEKLGVPGEKIVFFGQGSLTTRDEAKALKSLYGDRQDSLVLVTTNYHSRRAQRIFRAALPGVDVQVTCPGGCVAPEKWWKSPAVTAQFVLEFVKQIYYRLGIAAG